MLNFINLLERELDEPIYRFFPTDWLIQTFRYKRQSLCRPKIWEDPFENAVLKSAFELNGEIGDFSFHENYFGQCWTFIQESDAHWRIYSKNNLTAKVRSTPRKLLSSLVKHAEKPQLSCFLGKVSYLEETALLNSFQTILASQLLESSGQRLVETLLFKRKSFDYEQEVRLLYDDLDGRNKPDWFSYEFDPNLVFEEVLLHPRLSDQEVKALETELSSAGCRMPVDKSQLYHMPELRIRLIT